MLGLGWTEMFVVAAVALIVVGPRDLPVMLRQLGRAVGTVRRMGNEFRREFNKMAALDDIRDVRKSLTEPLRNARAEIEREFNKTTSTGVSPSGALVPDKSGESVVDAIKTQAGMSDAQSDSARQMAEAIKRSQEPVLPDTDSVPVELAGKSIAGPAATAPAKAKPARKPRAKSKTAKPADTAPADAKPKTTAKSRAAAKPKAEAAKAEPAVMPKTEAARSKPATKPKPVAKPKSAAASAATPKAAKKPAATAKTAAPARKPSGKAAAAKTAAAASAPKAKPRAASKRAAAGTAPADATPAKSTKPARRRASPNSEKA